MVCGEIEMEEREGRYDVRRDRHRGKGERRRGGR